MPARYVRLEGVSMQSRRIFIGKVASGLAGAIAAPNVLPRATASASVS
jgi:hypothetical protein